MIFDFLDVSKDGVLSVTDLIKMQGYLHSGSSLSRELSKLIEIHMSKNVRPKFVRHETIIDFYNFNALNPKPCLI